MPVREPPGVPRAAPLHPLRGRESRPSALRRERPPAHGMLPASPPNLPSTLISWSNQGRQRIECRLSAVTGTGRLGDTADTLCPVYTQCTWMGMTPNRVIAHHLHAQMMMMMMSGICNALIPGLSLSQGCSSIASCQFAWLMQQPAPGRLPHRGPSRLWQTGTAGLPAVQWRQATYLAVRVQ